MHALVCSGYARPGQTSWALLDTFELGMLLDFAYGELVKDLSPEQKAEVDKTLFDLDAEAVMVEVKQKSTGQVVQISEARLAQIRRNMGGKLTRPKPGTEAKK